MAPLNPLLEFRVHPTTASLEVPLGRGSASLEALASRCDDGSAYVSRALFVRGKRRIVSVPRSELDAVQRSISQILYPVDLSFGTAPHGYVVRRSTLTNALPHTGALMLQKFDIKDFFSNITATRIASTLQRLGFGPEAAILLARLTSCQGILPLGARTSARLSNIVLIELDDLLQALSKEHQLIYTRYADDLTFSSGELFDVREHVEDAVARLGFELNPLKTKRFKQGQPMFVTGLSVADAQFPRVRKRLKARLRQEFYYIEKFGLESHASAIGESANSVASRLTGEYHYCRAVEPGFTDSLSRAYPSTQALFAPVHEGSRQERAHRHRQAFLAEVSAAPPRTLPHYVPSAPLLDG
jgi:hypothetical protein